MPNPIEKLTDVQEKHLDTILLLQEYYRRLAKDAEEDLPKKAKNIAWYYSIQQYALPVIAIVGGFCGYKVESYKQAHIDNLFSKLCLVGKELSPISDKMIGLWAQSHQSCLQESMNSLQSRRDISFQNHTTVKNLSDSFSSSLQALEQKQDAMYR